MEGELVHVAVLNRLYFSSSRKRFLPSLSLLLTLLRSFISRFVTVPATLLHFHIVLPLPSPPSLILSSRALRNNRVKKLIADLYRYRERSIDRSFNDYRHETDPGLSKYQ